MFRPNLRSIGLLDFKVPSTKIISTDGQKHGQGIKYQLVYNCIAIQMMSNFYTFSNIDCEICHNFLYIIFLKKEKTTKI